MIIGNGKFQFTPEKDKSIEGAFRAAMLRFNPADQPAIISFDKGKKVRDVGATEMSRHMLTTVLRHCYQSTKDGDGGSRSSFRRKEHSPRCFTQRNTAIFSSRMPARKSSPSTSRTARRSTSGSKRPRCCGSDEPIDAE